MPFLQVFSIGEVLRRGVTDKPKKGLRGILEILFLVLLLLAQYHIFSLVYWAWLILKEVGISPFRDNIPPPNLDLSDEEPQEPPPPPLPAPPPQTASQHRRETALALSRAFTACAIVIAALLIGFVIVAASGSL